MHWQNLGMVDWIVVGAIGIALLAVIPIYRSDMRLRRKRSADWHRAYFQDGGLVRQLMARWVRTARLTDQSRRSDERH